ncbi:MAG: hypothetical protein DRI95_14855 [Bacteroidetes bacterium]|nr:MAG: hypothetical protein DRI95_14855 [Bacteroidota bacterium]
MELDEFKNIWAQYDQKLTDNLKFNENILRNMNLDKSKREMNTPLNYEIITVIMNFIALSYIVYTTTKFVGEFNYLVLGVLTSIIILAFLIFSIIKTSLLINIDYFNTPIINLQRAILKVKQKYLLFKKIEFYIYPFFAITLAPILAKVLRGIDLFSRPYLYILVIFIALLFGYFVAIWVYKNWYSKIIKNVSGFLEELNKFEKET